MSRDAERAFGDDQGSDWLGRITGALWVGFPLLVLLQVVALLPAINGFSLVPFAAILAVVLLVVLSFRNHRRGQVVVLVRGLALVNTFAWPPHTAALRGMLRLMGSRPMAAFNSGTNLMARMSSSRFGVGRHFSSEQKKAFLGMFRRKTSRRRFHSLMASALDVDYLAEVEAGLPELSGKPALTIFGKRNDPFGFQERWFTHFPDAEQMVIPVATTSPCATSPTAWRNASHHGTKPPSPSPTSLGVSRVRGRLWISWYGTSCE